MNSSLDRQLGIPQREASIFERYGFLRNLCHRTDSARGERLRCYEPGDAPLVEEVAYMNYALNTPV